MDNTNEKIAQITEKINRLKREQKVEVRRKKEAEKKLNQRRFYVVGEIVVKEFPELEKLIPGTKAENEKVFAGFECFLKELSSNEQVIQLFRKCTEPKSENHGNV